MTEKMNIEKLGKGRKLPQKQMKIKKDEKSKIMKTHKYEKRKMK